MSSIKILSIDDDSDFGQILKLKLKPPKYQLNFTSRTDDFLKILSQKEFDLILIDRNLGDQTLSGLALLEHLRGTLKIDTPIFIISHFDDFKGIQDALELGADDYLTKPLDDFIFESKLKSFFPSQIQTQLTRVPLSYSPIDISAHVNIREVNEMGLVVEAPFFIRKSSLVKMSGVLIKEVFKRDAINLNVGSSIIHQSRYIMNLEFDPDDQELQDFLKPYLAGF